MTLGELCSVCASESAQLVRGVDAAFYRKEIRDIVIDRKDIVQVSIVIIDIDGAGFEDPSALGSGQVSKSVLKRSLLMLESA